MGNCLSSRHMSPYFSLYRRREDTNPDTSKGDDEVFTLETTGHCCGFVSGSPRLIAFVLACLYGMTLICGLGVILLVVLVQALRSPRWWCREPLRTQDSSAEYCPLDLIHHMFPLTILDILTICAGSLTVIFCIVWFLYRKKAKSKHMYLLSGGLLVCLLAEVAIAIVISVVYAQRRQYLPIELRASIHKELKASMELYDTDTKIRETWDMVQQSWCCCGVIEPVDWRNSVNRDTIPRSCAVLLRANSPSFTCWGYPWTHTTHVSHPKYFEKENFHTTSRGCFELFAQEVGRDYVSTINVGWKILLVLAVMQLCGVMAPFVRLCCVEAAKVPRTITLSRTEMLSTRSMSSDSNNMQQQHQQQQQQQQQPQQLREPSAPPNPDLTSKGLAVC